MNTLWHCFCWQRFLRITSNKVNETDRSPRKNLLCRQTLVSSLLGIIHSTRVIHTLSVLSMKCNEKHHERSTHYGALLIVKLGTLVCSKVHLLGNLVYLTGTVSMSNTSCPVPGIRNQITTPGNRIFRMYACCISSVKQY